MAWLGKEQGTARLGSAWQGSAGHGTRTTNRPEQSGQLKKEAHMETWIVVIFCGICFLAGTCIGAVFGAAQAQSDQFEGAIYNEFVRRNGGDHGRI